MFDVLSIPMEIEHHEGEQPSVVRIHPEDLYPAIIARIKAVLAGDQPTELLAATERGGNARADTLVANARALPAQAWEDALRPREEFVDAPYFAFVERNGGVKAAMLDLVAKPARAAIERMIQRGYALEIAYGWFSQALRLREGSYDVTITSGVDGSRSFRL